MGSGSIFEAMESRRLFAATPVAFYTFEEGSGGSTADNSGGGHTGSVISASFGQGLIARYAMSFNGTSSEVRVSNAAALNPTVHISVSAWINPTAWANNRRILQKGLSDNQYRLTAEGGVLKWHIAGKTAVTTALPTTGEWHHVAGTYDGTLMRLYVDGQLAASVAASGAIPTTNDTLYIGTKHNTAPAGDRFTGRIDDVRIYNVALNDLEVQRLAGIVNINFQPAASAIPPKYLVDSGALFGDRGNGKTYGWNALHSDTAADRNIAADQRLDTLIRYHSAALWELSLTNGTYEVIASLGDPQQASTHTLLVEGVTFANGLALAANQFQTIRQTVTVADGRLSISNGAAADGATRINYVQVLTRDVDPGDPPATPVINEPNFDGQIVDPADVHMEAPDYFHPDGEPHASTDWEIRVVATNELVWEAPAMTGVEKLHIHLGDGVFTGSHATRSEMLPETEYILRVRYRDAEGAVSDYGVRLFTTGEHSSAVPLGIEDVLDAPVPQWKRTTGGLAVDLPEGTSMSLEGETGDLLLRHDGQAGAGNGVTNPPELEGHVHPRILLSATSAVLTLPQTDLTFTDDTGEVHIVYLPAVALGVGESAYFWIGADGSTYVGEESETEPDLTTPARLAPIPFIASQPGYVVETFTTGLQLPVNIAFVPNPGPDPDDVLFYVAELYGTIKVVTRDGTASDYVTGLLNFNPTGNFPGSGEQGLSGVVVDPATGDLYAGMVYSSQAGVEAAPHYPKVVRFTSIDGGRTAATQTTILDMAGETMGQSHFISNFTMGPDGKLYVHMGDGFNSGTAQNLDSFRGKILRVNLDSTAPSDNPFYDLGNGINSRDYVYAYGFRNPFGGAWRESDGMHYEVENGPSTDRLAQVVAGRNYLWNGSNASMQNFAIYNWNPSAAPVNMQFIQNGVFGGSGFPVSKMDHLFVTESGPTYATGVPGVGKKLTEWVLDAEGDLVSGPVNFVTYAGSGKGTFAALAAGPDGLYFSELYKDQDYNTPIDQGARIFRVRFIGSIPPDVAVTPLATTDQTPPLAGTVSDPAATISVTVGGQTLPATNNGDGTWTLADNALSPLADGIYDVQVSATNAFSTVGSDATVNELTIGEPGTRIAPDLQAASDTGSLNTDDVTNAVNPVFDASGVHAVATVELLRGGVVVATRIGPGSLTDTGAPDGMQTYNIRQRFGPGGINSDNSPDLVVNIDHTVPDAPSAPDLQSGSDSGSLNDDNITNDDSPTFDLDGTIEAGASIQLFRGVTLVDTITGAGAATDTGPVADDTYGYTTRQVDLAGNVSVAGTGLNVTIDTIVAAPSAPDLQTGSDSGTFNDDNITNDNSPTFNLGGTIEAGASIQLFRGVTFVDTITGADIATDTGPVADDTYSYTAKQVDLAGNVSVAGTGLNVTIDTVVAAPGAPDLQASSDSGTFNNDNVTNDDSPTFDLGGNIEAGASIELFRGATLVATITGAGAAIDAGPLADDSYSYAARQVDLAGNVSVASTGLNVTIDTIVAAPSAPDLQAGSDSGTFNDDNVTNDDSPTFDLGGTIETGASIELFRGVTLVDTITGAGAATDAGPVADDTYSYTARQVDLAGNVSVASIGLNVTIDTVVAAPSAPDLQAGSDSGTFNDDNVTNDNSPVFDLGGTIETGASIELFRGATLIATITGAGIATDTGPVADDTYSYTARQVDLAGNVSVASTGLNVTIDTIVAAPSAPDLQAGSDSGTFNDDNVTNDDSPTFDLGGTIETGASIQLFRGITLVATITGAGIATDIGPVADDTYSYTARQVDLAGNVSVASIGLNVTVDTVVAAPSAPDLQAGSDSGTFNDDNVTNDDSPTFDLGGTIETGASIQLFRGVTLVATITGAGIATDIGPVADDTYSYTARQVDLAGNVSVASTGLDITIDTLAPATAPMPDLQTASDSGLFDDDNLTNHNTPTFDIVTDIEAGAEVSLLFDGLPLVTRTGPGAITTPVLGDGAHNVTARQTDLAGNIGETSGVLMVTIDTVAPQILPGTTFNFESAQSIVYGFSEGVGSSLAAADIVVENLTSLTTVPDASKIVNYVPLTDTLKLTFAGFPAALLADGNYRITIAAPGLTDDAGNPLIATDIFDFFVLGADANRDRRVDVLDMTILAANWLGTGKTFSQADFNYDGVVNKADLGTMALNWHQTLAQPAPALPSVPVSARPASRAPTRTPTRVIDLVQ